MSQFGDFGMMLAAAEAAAATDPNLAYTVALLGFDGADGSTSFNDESPAAHGAVGFTGNAQIDTAQAKFGVSSCLFDGSGDRVSFGNSEDWAPAAGGEFSAECWVRPTNVTGARWFVGHAQGLDAGDRGNSSWVLWAFNGVIRMSYNDGSAWQEGASVAPAATLVTNVWQHVAWDRDSTGKIRIYHDGVMLGSRTSGTTIFNPVVSMGLYMGDAGDSGGGDFAGHMDEVRVLKGKAAWASDAGFTPPSSPYARS